MRILAAMMAGGLLASGAAAEVNRWGSHYNMGIYAVGVGEPDADRGGWLSLQCSAAKGEGYIYAQIAGQTPPPGSTLAITVAAGRATTQHRFTVDDGGDVTTDPRSPAFEALWNDLRRGTTATVTFADGRKWTAPLAGAARALDPGGCVD